MNDLITQLRKSYTADSYQSAMRLIQDQFEQDQPYICLYWRSAVLLSRETFTDVRDVRELEMLRGIENYGELTPYKKNRPHDGSFFMPLIRPDYARSLISLQSLSRNSSSFMVTV